MLTYAQCYRAAQPLLDQKGDQGSRYSCICLLRFRRLNTEDKPPNFIRLYEALLRDCGLFTDGTPSLLMNRLGLNHDEKISSRIMFLELAAILSEEEGWNANEVAAVSKSKETIGTSHA